MILCNRYDYCARVRAQQKQKKKSIKNFTFFRPNDGHLQMMAFLWSSSLAHLMFYFLFQKVKLNAHSQQK